MSHLIYVEERTVEDEIDFLETLRATPAKDNPDIPADIEEQMEELRETLLGIKRDTEGLIAVNPKARKSYLAQRDAVEADIAETIRALMPNFPWKK